MGRRNNKEPMSIHNSTTTEPDKTEMQRLPEGQTRNLTVELIQDFQKDFSESLEEIKDAVNEMMTSMQTINTRLDHMEGRISLVEYDHSKNEHRVYKLEKIPQNEMDMEEIWTNLRRENLRIIGIEEEKRS